MAIPYSTASRTWDLGTVADGRFFETEFDQLYSNDNDLDGRVEDLETIVAVTATPQATTSGTEKDFTGIPSWATQIVVMFAGVSTNGTSYPLVQIGDSGGVETSGYFGAFSRPGEYVTLSSGFSIHTSAATDTYSGIMVLSLLDASTNTWACASSLGIGSGNGAGFVTLTAGHKALSATLDRVRITTTNGPDAFDAGSVNISYR